MAGVVVWRFHLGFSSGEIMTAMLVDGIRPNLMTPEDQPRG